MLSPKSLQSSNGSSLANLDYKSDLEKLTSLCKELESNGGNKNKKKLDISHREYLHKEIQNLEKKLKETNTQNYHLKEQLVSKEEEINKYKTQMNKQGNTIGFQYAQKHDLQEKYLSNVEHTNDIIERNKDQYLNYRSELDYKSKEINELQKDLKERTEKMSSAIISNDRNFEKVFSLEKQLQAKENEINELKNKLEQQEKENERLLFAKKSEGISIIEVEHLRNDVRRLLQMLKSTSEFQNFAEFADDNTKSITFLKEIPVKSIVDCNCACIKCKHVRPCLVEQSKYVDEKTLWAPTEAFNFIHQYRIQYKGELNETLIENLFFELNKIWCKREEKAIDRVKASFAHEIASLRRQLQINNKYDSVVNKSEINRLKGQLKKAYKENRENFDNRAKRNPSEVEIIKEAMKMKQETEKFKKRFYDENAFLKNALSRMESNKFKDNSEKAVFMEGIAFAVSKISKECDFTLENVFRVLKKYSMGEDTLSDRETMINSIENEMNKIKESINYLKEFSEKEMGKANHSVKRSMSRNKG